MYSWIIFQLSQGYDPCERHVHKKLTELIWRRQPAAHRAFRSLLLRLCPAQRHAAYPMCFFLLQLPAPCCAVSQWEWLEYFLCQSQIYFIKCSLCALELCMKGVRVWAVIELSRAWLPSFSWGLWPVGAADAMVAWHVQAHPAPLSGPRTSAARALSVYCFCLCTLFCGKKCSFLLIFSF